MEQHGFDKHSRVEVEPWGKRLVNGIAIDLLFGVILVIAFVVTEDCGIGFLVALGVLVAGYLAWRVFSGTGTNSPPRSDE